MILGLALVPSKSFQDEVCLPQAI
ncbi:hypothetical protein HMPREF9989_04708 [Staphylococcus epidermidis NIHLM057]|nr:hypothetical protein HMPREF9989_04708 [Staphylococcus epidermidis NIHLM057]EJD98849.1 hypothetical protein HMPREF9988_01143 [Staphylococcus epidermidis NIHLM053]